MEHFHYIFLTLVLCHSLKFSIGKPCDVIGWTDWGPCSKLGIVEKYLKIRCPNGIKPETCMKVCNLTVPDVLQSKQESDCAAVKGKCDLLIQRKEYCNGKCKTEKGKSDALT